MISKTLTLIAKHLEEFLKITTASQKSRIKLSNVEVSNTADNTLIVSLVNISEEAHFSNPIASKQHDLSEVKQTPPLYLSLDILISACYDQNHYQEGLRMLSLALSFFQKHRIFDANNFELPKGIDRLSFELVNQDLDSMSKLWNALGMHYRPSVLYKMRLLKIESDTLERVIPEINSPNIV